jgi:hypothetical protein
VSAFELVFQLARYRRLRQKCDFEHILTGGIMLGLRRNRGGYICKIIVAGPFRFPPPKNLDCFLLPYFGRLDGFLCRRPIDPKTVELGERV